MTYKFSHIFILSLTSCLTLSPSVLAKSQFLPEAIDNWGNHNSPNTSVNSDYNNCIKEGYTIKSCPPGYALDIKERCPYGLNSPLYKKCYSLAELCQDKGFQLSCTEGYEPNLNEYCPYDSVYVKCQCAKCLGYDYTEAEANAEGYIPDGEPCMSCATPMYKRKINPCDGFKYDVESCGATSCGNVAGEYCKSGTTYKYKDCKSCTVPSCPDGKINFHSYWCNSALSCWWPGTDNQQCTQTACFDYPYSASVTCKPGTIKKSCKDSCVGDRYKCEPATGCTGFDLTEQKGCEDGYESCTDTSGLKHYKCRICTGCDGYTLKQQAGCDYGYEECLDSCGINRYKCAACSTTGCEGYTLTSTASCKYGYDSCTSECGKTTYKCKNCTPKDCSDYTLSSQTGCANGYLTCDTGCGKVTYKCKPYAIGDSYYQNGILIGIVIDISGTNVIIASPPKISSAEISPYCDAKSPGTWYQPNHTYGYKIFKTYRSTFSDPSFSYLRIRIGSYLSSDYCVSDSTTWMKSTCLMSGHTVYNSCLLAVQQIQ